MINTNIRINGIIELELTVGEKVQNALEQEETQQQQQTPSIDDFSGLFPFPFGGFFGE